jgi:hypothetical protein
MNKASVGNVLFSEHLTWTFDFFVPGRYLFVRGGLARLVILADQQHQHAKVVV